MTFTIENPWKTARELAIVVGSIASMSAVIVKVGSMKFDLQLLVVKMYSNCLVHGIDLYIDWIPRTENSQADFISKIRECIDWQITAELLLTLDTLWGIEAHHRWFCFLL